MFTRYLKWFNRVLAVTGVILFFGIAATFFPGSLPLLKFSKGGEAICEDDFSKPYSFKPSEESESFRVTKRIFVRDTPVETKSPERSTEKEKSLIKDLNLVGIVRDKGLRAAIEDQKTHKTHLLNINDDISGFKIVEIHEHEVVLKGAQETYKLAM